MQLVTGGWATAIVGTGARHGVFNSLEGAGDTVEGVAAKTGISPRGAQAILDGLTGLGLLNFANGRYTNGAHASAFLVKGKPAYFGGMAEVMTESMKGWTTLPEAAKTGQPTAAHTADMPDNEFWHQLVPATASLSFPVAQLAAERLGVAKAGVRVAPGGLPGVDDGGGIQVGRLRPDADALDAG